MPSINVGVIGSRGRMGQACEAALLAAPDMHLEGSLGRDGDVFAFLSETLDVVVDLSLGHAVDQHGEQVVRAGKPYIVGATGYSSATLEALRAASAASGSPVLIVPNFSLGANLMIKFAAAASRLMAAPVITERHHTGKADAPSGTAVFTAQRIAQARAGAERPGFDSSAMHYKEALSGVLGADLDGVAIHSVRGDGYLAEQEVLLSLPGESLRIEHRSIDRRCFMPGILYAIRNIQRVNGLQIGLDTILDV
ncbi:4-hydroxy-tetrahydrodipicolinate reductase [bacterium]|nr:4-hydroxy-tetrahydrodipicolinate reductase [bacterium]